MNFEAGKLICEENGMGQQSKIKLREIFLKVLPLIATGRDRARYFDLVNEFDEALEESMQAETEPVFKESNRIQQWRNTSSITDKLQTPKNLEYKY